MFHETCTSPRSTHTYSNNSSSPYISTFPPPSTSRISLNFWKKGRKKKKMFKRACVSSLSLFLFLAYFCLHAKGWSGNGDWGAGPLFPKDKRETIVSTEYGEISAAQVSDGTRRGSYHLQFFTLEPNSLFLPVLLHTDMVFYVHTGTSLKTF